MIKRTTVCSGNSAGDGEIGEHFSRNSGTHTIDARSCHQNLGRALVIVPLGNSRELYAILLSQRVALLKGTNV